MRYFTPFIYGFLFLFTITTKAQASHVFTATIRISDELQKEVKPNGRLLIFITTNTKAEPRQLIWPSPVGKTYIFGKNITDFDPESPILILGSEDWKSNTNVTMGELPTGDYAIQAVWDQDTNESRSTSPGNLYSKKQLFTHNKPVNLNLDITEKIAELKVTEHPLVRVETYQSKVLSKFWGKPMFQKVAILLPATYREGDEVAYPIRYNIAGYGGRYTRINRVIANEKFMRWWQSYKSPDVINVFLDSEGPFGDCYQMDSDNSGPYGESLVNELIPFIENKYRNTNSATTRFVDGCSTGGWVSLGLQLYYPNTFNGCFSYSPDAIEFENYQLTNIYKDKNIYVNEFGYERPIMRSILGEPMVSTRQFLAIENVLGSSDNYLTSAGQIGAHTALYSPKGVDGLPKPLFDPITGEIDSSVAEHWKKYDFKIYAEKNWKTLGPKIQDKIYIWMGDMDHFYLNMATRSFANFLKKTTYPKSDAVIEFAPMQGHCTQFSNKRVLEQIQKRLRKVIGK